MRVGSKFEGEIDMKPASPEIPWRKWLRCTWYVLRASDEGEEDLVKQNLIITDVSPRQESSAIAIDARQV